MAIQRSAFVAALLITQTGLARAQTPTATVVVESEHASVTASAVRRQMAQCGVNALSPIDAPATPHISVAVAFSAPEAATRFRLRVPGAEPQSAAADAPREDVVEWIAARACRMVRRATRPARNAASMMRQASRTEPRPQTEVLDPWSASRTLAATVTDPWRNQSPRRRSVGSLAGAAVVRFSEVLDPWSRSRRPHSPEVIDPWSQEEGAERLARPRRRRRR